MKTYGIHEAKANLSKLVELAAKGESFVITVNGKPMVRVTAVDASNSSQVKRIGFMEGQIEVPDDFDRMGASHIQSAFELDS